MNFESMRKIAGINRDAGCGVIEALSRKNVRALKSMRILNQGIGKMIVSAQLR